MGNQKAVGKQVVRQLVETYRKKYTVTAILSAVGVARSTYYRWLADGLTSELTQVEQDIIALCKKTKYRSAPHAKTQPAMPGEEETEMEITRGIGHCGPEPVGTEFYRRCPKREMGDGYYVYSVGKRDALPVDVMDL